MPEGPDDQGYDIPLPGMPAEPSTESVRRPGLPTTSATGAPLPQLDAEERSTSRFREQAFTFITGRKAGGALEGDRSAQMMAAFGPSPRDPDRPNVAAAAKAMKVHPSSVRRWLAGKGMSKTHEKALVRRSRQAMTTKRGRAAIARAAGPLTPPKGRNGIKVEGDMGKVSASDGNYRPRTARVQTSHEDLAQLQELWVEHGEAGVDAWLHQQYGEHYEPDWHFRAVDGIDWDTNVTY